MNGRLRLLAGAWMLLAVVNANAQVTRTWYARDFVESVGGAVHNQPVSTDEGFSWVIQ